MDLRRRHPPLRRRRRLACGDHGAGGAGGGVGQVLAASLFALPFLAGEAAGFIFLASASSPAMVAVLAATVGTLLLFHRLLAAPTRAGGALLDKVEGFREFLAAVEGDRLDTLYPAGRTPELFERYLPWALALDVEQQWAERFSGVLARAGSGPGGYSPAWYAGLSTVPRHVLLRFLARRRARLGGLLLVHSPRLVVRIGGGGSSGGGGGGGGGGGW